MEKWDILDSSGKITGKTAVRGKYFMRPGEYHLVVHIWVISNDGKFLIQQRSKEKKLMPGEWAATGGSAISGETSFCAAQRELLEELGINCTQRYCKKMARIKKRNSFVDIWFTMSDADVSSLQLQLSEVAQARWVSEDTLRKMVENGEFHNYGKEYFDMIFRFAKEYRNEFGN
ncbi:MAG: NUDIX domain-containing protein [Acutalibacteraceae bacterium]|nr:NUDIX domain-containing protein [Acutalibacteraceae bacterium]